MGGNEQKVGAGEVKVEGQGNVSDPMEEMVDDNIAVNEEDEDNVSVEDEKTDEEMAEEMPTGNDAVEYNPAGNSMEDIAEGGEETDQNEKDASVNDAVNEDEASETSGLNTEELGLGNPEEKTMAPENQESPIDETKTIEKPTLKTSTRPGFDSTSVQDARKDTTEEGGIAHPRTTGPHKTSGDASEEGSIIRPMDSEPADKNKIFEVSGFKVSYEPSKGEGLISKSVSNHFPDIDTAMASVNGDKYLMPVVGGGFRAVTIIEGAPIISTSDRQVYRYIEEKWKRV